MTIEITDRADFKEKFASLMAANMLLINAGSPPSAELSGDIIDEFLNQFVIATPAPAPSVSAGFIVAIRHAGGIPYDFKGNLYKSKADAQLAVTTFIGDRGYGSTRDYDIKEVTYFG